MMRVVKIGGRAQAAPELARAVAAAWRENPKALCIVHGGGDEITAMQNALGKEATFVGGRRVTSQGDLELLRMVLSGSVNKRLVNLLVAEGVPAVGISGEDSALIRAESIDRQTLGFAGRPKRIEPRLIHTLLDAGFLPLISPVAYDLSSDQGGILNVNGDDAAAAIASSLRADELLFVADVEGVQDESGRIIATIEPGFARDLIAQGTASGGMAAKLESAHVALAGGVKRVRISDLAGLTDMERGTSITQAEGVLS
ncbi:MAG TPA: acetylglutamate kinase [Gemmatimonadaceae bacterium]|nr:acetylglutamate kinase [Gemmatimonadaceae bacterium]